MTLFTLTDAADIIDTKPAVLRLLIEEGKFRPTRWTKSNGVTDYYFTKDELDTLSKLILGSQETPAKAVFVDDGKQETFTVAEIGALWKLSADTIQKLFQDEPGVITLGNKNPKGKRPRVTLRIPRSVMERVKKRRSNL